MRGRWVSSLGAALSLWVADASAQDRAWTPVAAPPRVIASSVPAASQQGPAATLGPPRALNTVTSRAPIPDAQVVPVAHRTPVLAPPRAIVRAQAPDPPPPGVSGPIPAVPPYPGTEELYNRGVVTDPAGRGFWDKARGLFGGGTGACESSCGRGLFQSDHAFDGFISPVTNPFLFEDPRSLTEVRPIFLFQTAPSGNPGFRGGQMEFFGLQGRLALTERLSFVINKLGGVAIQPNDNTLGFEDTTGFAEINLGPKYTFLRNEQTGTLAAGGLTFAIPTGSSKVFQDTGSLSLIPYLSFGQNFLRSSYGSFNFLSTTGYSFSVDDDRSDFFYASLHLDYNIADANKIYPLIELNWTHYTKSGDVRNFGFEGRDLFNFGSRDVSGNDNLTLALGARYKFSECVQVGTGFEFPLVGRRDLLDFRWTADLIIRY